jgi:hypothetical protein
MRIELTKEQFENLVKLVYLGNWLANGVRLQSERVKKFEEIEQLIYSQAVKSGLGDGIEFDSGCGEYFPKPEFEEGLEIEGYKKAYDDETFWEELVSKMANRDFIAKYGEAAVNAMDERQRIEKLYNFISKYEDYFENRGIDGLKAVDMEDY